MSNTVITCFQESYQKNLILLEAVREEQWDAVTELAEEYVTLLQDIFENFPQALTSHENEFTVEEKNSLRDVIQCLQANDKEIANSLKSRLSFLQKNMSALHHGNQCSQLYNAQYMSIMSTVN
ncbi:flagellar protein FliT [Yersinia massiliensis]|jgi:DNA/RNA-binding domain of Phe-tRNA-synthetase-like protein|uniref:Flagellar protein FliT n=1 Tax=Yersinia massiliensis TaxID=419257 RepID=A0ABM6UPV2_9GAMM|nr:flagellar protein FliT [Yersinia massiliensis]AVX36873.1 flagellar protein FliT [Yersinia massiliensis]QKJ11676.1 flagellar protein FliT [Yersinia massiliensis]